MDEDIKKLSEQAALYAGKLESALSEMRKVIVGQDETLEKLLIALVADGHVLLEGVPGLAKTLMVKTLTETTNTSFSRIQFTPDLLPADIVGTKIYDQGKGTFTTQKGPIFHNFILADEINRAPPKVQSALLEAMQERQVSIHGNTYPLERPFMVLATQNPVELKGTFPLPEAQVDRFLVCLRMGYPSPEEEKSMLARFRTGDPLAEVRAVVSQETLSAARAEVRAVHVADDIARYIVAIAQATRETALVRLGASPRASLALQRAAQAAAALAGRDYVTPNDVQGLITAVLAHRLVLARDAAIDRRDPQDVLLEVVAAVPVPAEPREDEPAAT